MPYDLKRLFIENDEESAHFRNNVRSYNNNLGFTFVAAKYDPELTKNMKSVYIFRVQELAKRIESSDKLRESTLRLLMRILSNNPYAKFFKNLRNVPNIDTYRIVLNCYPGLDQRVYNLPTASQVAAIWTEDDGESADRNIHIQVYTYSNTSHRIKHYYGCYDPLQYPILFPQGEYGWHHGVKKLCKRKRKADSCEDDLNVDPSSFDDLSHLLDLEGRAVEHGKNEDDTVSAREYFRSKILQGVLDSISLDQTKGSKVDRRIMLPASFIDGPRDMRYRYLDIMALVQKYEKSDISLTMTCNPAWKEIQCNLKYHEKSQNRPDLLARVFRAKFEMIKHELLNRQIFGEVEASIYVIEFQKQGFSHVQLLLI
ncbi:uncharacterized protein [Coffea arabica]|uniref:Helitron helicase-like domain-containing protein n=1 Tax=Coffea arabica TaxID=13443 RepID=A0A6P6SZW5_COFAR|nr:uncharacterized protein LOC113696372 [Coffea arabica]